MTADPITRLNAALEGRYAIEREIGEGEESEDSKKDDLQELLDGSATPPHRGEAKGLG